jgi:hypothetical protein
LFSFLTLGIDLSLSSGCGGSLVTIAIMLGCPGGIGLSSVLGFFSDGALVGASALLLGGMAPLHATMMSGRLKSTGNATRRKHPKVFAVVRC